MTSHEALVFRCRGLVGMQSALREMQPRSILRASLASSYRPVQTRTGQGFVHGGPVPH